MLMHCLIFLQHTPPRNLGLPRFFRHPEHKFVLVLNIETFQ